MNCEVQEVKLRTHVHAHVHVHVHSSTLVCHLYCVPAVGCEIGIYYSILSHVFP